MGDADNSREAIKERIAQSLEELIVKPPELATWLEDKLVSQEFGILIEYLGESIAGLDAPSQKPVKLAKILDRLTLHDVLESGLEILSFEQLLLLLTNPDALLKLQEEILVKGGEYWGEKLAVSLAGYNTQAAFERLRPLLRSTPEGINPDSSEVQSSGPNDKLREVGDGSN